MSSPVLAPRTSCVGYHRVLEDVLQGKLNQSGRHRGLRDDAEGGRPKSCARIGELRVIQSVVKFRAECKLSDFVQATDGGDFADGDIRIELYRLPYDALSRSLVS